MSAVIQNKTEKDPRVEAAISHWAPRFVANGVPLTDFQEVTASVSRWEDWCSAWSARAAIHEELGNKALAGGYALSAAAHFTRAAVCYHFGKFLFVNDMAQMKEAHRRAVECRNKALPHLDPPGERVAIPYEGKQLYGNLRKPTAQPSSAAKASNGGSAAKPPIVVMCMGLDSAKEEMDDYENRFLARGLATLAFDGPGQGEAEYDFAIRPDWEVPGTAIIDAASALPGIDADRIGIWGVSLGGYYAARVAGGDHRVRATIALCGPYCLGDIWDQLPELSRAAFTVRSKSGSDEQARAAASQLSLDGIGAKITAPLLIIAGQRDRIFPWQDAERLHQEVGQNSELMLLPDGNHGCANVTYKHRNYGADWMAAALA